LIVLFYVSFFKTQLKQYNQLCFHLIDSLHK